MDREFIEEAVKTLLIALGDFQTDKRGDVGSWVRMEAITGLRDLMNFMSEGGDQVIIALVSHTAERLDKIGKQALDVLKTLKYPDSKLLEIFLQAQDQYSGICSLIELLPPQPLLVSQLALSCSNASAEREIVNMSIEGKTKAIAAIFESLISKEFRYQSKSDFTHRALVPAIHFLSLLSEILSPEDLVEKLHIPLIVPTVRRGFNLELFKAVSKLYSLFLASHKSALLSFFVNEVLSSAVPKVRITAAGDLMRVLLNADENELVEVVDSADWLSENDSDWLDAARRVADRLGVAIEVKLETRGRDREVKQEKEGYYEFIKEVYRYS
jgi:hypothetical protein